MNNRYIRRIIALIALMAIINPALSNASMEEPFPFVRFAINQLPLRKDASTSAQITITIPAGEAVSVTGAEGDYYMVTYEGIGGYALKKLLSATQSSSTLPTPLKASAAVKDTYPTLTEGDQGEMVTAVQQALIELGFLKGTADGKYGAKTTTALSEFQKKNSLPSNGIADPVSQQRLFEGKPLNSRGKRTTVKTVPPIQGLVLRPGDSGIPVEKMQRKLKDLGFYSGKIDGSYGKGTSAALAAFQKHHKLKADGIAGKKTLELLYSENTLSANATQAPQPSATQTPEPITSNVFVEPKAEEAVYPYETTTTDSVNIRKRASVQSMRVITVPKGETIKVLSVSGDYLNVEYKKYSGFVLQDYVNIPEQYLAGKSFTSDNDARQRYTTIALGAEGPNVKALQQALSELGFYSGTPDSNFGAATVQAIKKFQETNGYKATGVALPELQKLIYEGKPKSSKNRKVNVSVLPPVANPEMQLGDTGDAVEGLQQTLTQLGLYTGKINGEYNKETVNAVKAYQKAHSIKITGKMNSFTWLSLQTVLSPTSAPSVDGTGDLPVITEQNVIVMRKGTRGLAVSRLQQRLVDLGYYQTTPDGVYNVKDMDAVRAFQRNNGLTSSGIADLYTQKTLYSAGAVPGSETPPENWQSLSTIPPVSVTTAPIYNETLKIGTSGAMVEALQTRLIALNYLSGKADGVYGTQTAKAITAFQQKAGLKADGMAGTETLTRLYAADASQNAAGTTPPSGDTYTRALKVGTRGEDVRSAQNRLITLKYYTGIADGIYSPNMALAVQAFQKRNKLTADGIVGSLTWAKLNSSLSAGNSVLPVPPLSSPETQPQTPPSTGFTAPRASEVRFAMWEPEIIKRVQAMNDVIVYDFSTGVHYNVHVFSCGKHADGEPVTKEDTAAMNRAIGVNNWTPKPVWVILSDGRVYMASTHSRGHEVDHNPNNNLTGHICIHFPHEMAKAIAIGPYAVSHQNAILAGWDVTNEMAKK